MEVRWNTSGTVLACSGRQWVTVPNVPDQRRPNNQIQFYNPFGQVRVWRVFEWSGYSCFASMR